MRWTDFTQQIKLGPFSWDDIQREGRRYDQTLEMTPRYALITKEMVRFLVNERAERTAMESMWRACDARDAVSCIFAIRGLIDRCETVLWSWNVWQSAISGCDVFLREPPPGEIMPPDGLPPYQFWTFSNLPKATPEAVQFFELPFDAAVIWGMTILLFDMDCPQGDPNEVITGVSYIFGPSQEDAAAPTLVMRHMSLGSRTPVAAPLSPVVAGLKFMTLPFVSTQRRHAARDERERRWLQKKRRPVPSVSTIVLRREQRQGDRPGEGSEVDWSCRWLVRGHWRSQWYPSEGKHKPAFVHPYVKGPDDKPLKPPRDSIYLVRR